METRPSQPGPEYFRRRPPRRNPYTAGMLCLYCGRQAHALGRVNEDTGVPAAVASALDVLLSGMVTRA